MTLGIVALILAVAALGIWLNRDRPDPPCRCGPEECEGWGKKGFTCQREKRT